jgi:hypothetical protein
MHTNCQFFLHRKPSFAFANACKLINNYWVSCSQQPTTHGPLDANDA